MFHWKSEDGLVFKKPLFELSVRKTSNRSKTDQNNLQQRRRLCEYRYKVLPLWIILLWSVLGVGLSLVARAGVEPPPNTIINLQKLQTYSTVQAAVDDAQENDTLIIGCGVYDERVYVRKSVTLAGPTTCNDAGPTIRGIAGTAIETNNQDRMKLVVSGLRLYGNIVSDANSTEIVNTELYGPGAGRGTALALNWHPGPTELKFERNIVKGWEYAVHGEDFAPGAKIIGNRLRAVSNGFYLVNAPEAHIEHNYIQNYIDVESVTSIRRFYGGIGVALVRAPGSVVFKNTICGTHTGVRVDANSHGSVVDLNVVSSDTDALDNEYRPALLKQLRSEGVSEEQLMTKYEEVARGKGGGVVVSYSDDVKVTRGRFCRGAYGVEINNAKRTVVEDNSIMLMTIGIDVTPHEAPHGDPEWAVRIGRNFYGSPDGISVDGVDDAIGQPRRTRRPARVNISDHKERIVSIAPHYSELAVPNDQFLMICPKLRGEDGWQEPSEYDY